MLLNITPIFGNNFGSRVEAHANLLNRLQTFTKYEGAGGVAVSFSAFCAGGRGFDSHIHQS